MNVEKHVVAHSLEKWLSLTMNWVYTQLKFNPSFSSIILTSSIQNLDWFPWESIYSLPSYYPRFVLRGLRKLGIRFIPSTYIRAIHRYNPRILHSHFGNRAWHDIPMAKKYNLLHIVTFYGSDISQLPTRQPVWKNRYRELFRNATLFLCEGPYMASSLVKMGCPREKVKIQRLGIEIERIPFIPRKLENGEVKILIAGTFREKKGIPFALEAIGQLRYRYPKIKITLIGDVAGGYRDHEEKKKIIAIISRNNLENDIRLLGFQPYDILIKEAYQHHIFLSPSVTASDGDTEGGAPVTIIEMAASGMPIVSTDHCDIPQIIQHRKSGLLARERNVDDLVELLSWLISHPKDWREMLYAARQNVEANFNARIQGQKLGEIYNEVLNF